jgi:tRNA U54 and U55 pseudouridine synthase Pus10
MRSVKRQQRTTRVVQQDRARRVHNRTLDILQLNAHKRSEVQQSLLNDEGLKDYAMLCWPFPNYMQGR